MNIEDSFIRYCKRMVRMILIRKPTGIFIGTTLHLQSGRRYFTKDKFYTQLRLLSKEIIKQRASVESNVTIEYLEEEIKKIVADAKFRIPRNLDSYLRGRLNTLIAGIRASVAQNLVIVPLEGIEIEKNFRFGDIDFRRGTKALFRSIARKYNISRSNILFPTGNKKKLTKTYAICLVTASESKKATEKGITKVEEVMNIIRFFHSPNNFGIQGNYIAPSLFEYIIINIRSRVTTQTLGWSRLTATLSLDIKRIKLLNQRGLVRLKNMYMKGDSRTIFENVTYGAIQWFGKTVRDFDLVDNFIKCIIALETLLLNRYDEKNNNLAERVAMIYFGAMRGRNRRNRIILRKDRKLLFDIIKDAYKKRNDIVHDGSTNVKELEYNRLRGIVWHIIMKILNDFGKYKTRDDWLKYVEREKFA